MKKRQSPDFRSPEDDISVTCKDEPHNCDYFSLGKDSLVFVNVHKGKEWNKAIHNGVTLPLVLTWYCHAGQNSKMAAEVFPRMTS